MTNISRTSAATLFAMTSPVRLHGIRGATTVARNYAGEILAATDELLRTLIEANDLEPDDIVSALFTVTRDLDAAFPARAAEELGGILWPYCMPLKSRSRDLSLNAFGCWSMPTLAEAVRKSNIAISAEPRFSGPTGCEQPSGHTQRR